MSLSREQMLAEMGISPIWKLREPVADEGWAEAPADLSADSVADMVVDSPAAAAANPPDAAPPPPRAVVAEAPPAAVPVEARSPAPPVSPGVPATPAGIESMDWPELTRAVAECKACTLCQQRKQAVLGVGDRNPDWLFIGEGPGAEEDVQGEPFVGQAGKLLDAMLAAIDLARGDKVYIGNAVKCRPPGNRTPEAAEMAACRPYLERQIALLKPKVIVLLGKAAVHSLLHDDKSLASMRGQRFEYAGIPVVVTYHPAYLLRNLPDKAKAWEDLLFARRVLRQQAEPALPF